jgi:nitroimidazol reductase NimA-like FMN-containing flavoprotein (pyridoxamine 5'-phosphate oxidase superfamily)
MAWKKAKKLKFLSDAPVIRVATVSKHGRPQVTPVCHVVSQGKIYWASDFDAVKLANLHRHRRVALVADEYRADWRHMGGVMAQGRAKIIRDGPLFRRIRDLLYRKFRVYKSNAPFDEGESAIIEVTPDNLISWWFK